MQQHHSLLKQEVVEHTQDSTYNVVHLFVEVIILGQHQQYDKRHVYVMRVPLLGVVQDP